MKKNTTMRLASRIDSNQPEIVEELRKQGCSVYHVHKLKNGFDILVGYKGKNYCFEIKDPDKPPSQRKLTKGEQEFFDTWKGQVDIIEDWVDAMNHMARHNVVHV